MIKIYAQEFVNICGYITKKVPTQICKKYLYIEPDKLRAMLDKNKFDETNAKLHIWRDLSWLICEPDMFTKSITVNKRRKRVCVLNLAAYIQLRELLAVEKKAADLQDRGREDGTRGSA